MKVCGNIEGIEFVQFDDRDVVRHKLVQQIVKAYEAYTLGGNMARPSTLREPAGSVNAARGEPVEPRA
jgi:phosphate starvation-inducible PhoH-like protein